MPLHRDRCSPREIRDTASLDELHEAARSLDAWERHDADVLDYVYRHRIVQLIEQRAGIEELEELLDHLRRVVDPRREDEINSLGERFVDRWKGYARILDGRIAGLRSRDPDVILKRAHVRPILDLVRETAGIRQREVAKQTGLGSANLTRVLNLMEANGLIERRAEGREKRIQLGPAGLKVAGAVRTPAPRLAQVYRGMKYLATTTSVA